MEIKWKSTTNLIHFKRIYVNYYVYKLILTHARLEIIIAITLIHFIIQLI